MKFNIGDRVTYTKDKSTIVGTIKDYPYSNLKELIDDDMNHCNISWDDLEQAYKLSPFPEGLWSESVLNLAHESNDILKDLCSK
jgi:hypothetical protein